MEPYYLRLNGATWAEIATALTGDYKNATKIRKQIMESLGTES